MPLLGLVKPEPEPEKKILFLDLAQLYVWNADFELPKYLKDSFKLLPEVRGLKLEVALEDAVVLTLVGVVEKDLVLVGATGV